MLPQNPPKFILEVHLERNCTLDTVQLRFNSRDKLDETCARIVDACVGEQPNAAQMFMDDVGFAVFYPREFVSCRALGFSQIAQTPSIVGMDFRA